MDLLSLHFVVFLVCFLAVYYVVPSRYKYLVILVGSYIFYGYENPMLPLFLVLTTVITYVGGLLLERHADRRILLVAFAVNLLPLFIFKYSDFVLQAVNSAVLHLGGGTTCADCA